MFAEEEKLAKNGYFVLKMDSLQKKQHVCKNISPVIFINQGKAIIQRATLITRLIKLNLNQFII